MPLAARAAADDQNLGYLAIGQGLAQCTAANHPAETENDNAHGHSLALARALKVTPEEPGAPFKGVAIKVS